MTMVQDMPLNGWDSCMWGSQAALPLTKDNDHDV